MCVCVCLCVCVYVRIYIYIIYIYVCMYSPKGSAASIDSFGAHRRQSAERNDRKLIRSYSDLEEEEHTGADSGEPDRLQDSKFVRGYSYLEEDDRTGSVSQVSESEFSEDQSPRAQRNTQPPGRAASDQSEFSRISEDPSVLRRAASDESDYNAPYQHYPAHPDDVARPSAEVPTHSHAPRDMPQPTLPTLLARSGPAAATTTVISPRGAGVGLSFEANESGEMVVVALRSGGAAERSGDVFIGDTIVAVNGHATKGLSVEEMLHLVSAGPPESSVRLDVLSPHERRVRSVFLRRSVQMAVGIEYHGEDADVLSSPQQLTPRQAPLSAPMGDTEEEAHKLKMVQALYSRPNHLQHPPAQHQHQHQHQHQQQHQQQQHQHHQHQNQHQHQQQEMTEHLRPHEVSRTSRASA